MEFKTTSTAIVFFLLANITMAEASELAEQFWLSGSVGNASHSLQHQRQDDYQNSVMSYGINFDYSLSEHFAVGLGYVDFGKAQLVHHLNPFIDRRQSSQGNGTTLSALVHTGKSDGPWSGFARAGLIRWKVDDITVSNLGAREVFKSSWSGTDFFFGLGTAYRLSSSLQATLTADWYDMTYYNDNVVFFDANGNVFDTTPYTQSFTVLGVGLSHSF